jgi:cytochrome P450
MLVLRRREDVVRSLSDTSHFGMAGVTEAGELRKCPLTGAEMQSPDGGLLNMNPPLLRVYRQRINGLFSRRAADATRPAIHQIATGLSAKLSTRSMVDAIAEFAEPFTAEAVCWAMGIPRADWDQLLEFSRVAFAVVPSPAAVTEVARAWEDLYSYYEKIVAGKRARPDKALTSQLIGALDGYSSRQVAHVIATVSNGFGALLPILATAIAEVAQRPRLIADCQSGEQGCAKVAAELLSGRAIFPVALPRIALSDTWLGDRFLSRGALVLPSLAGAARDHSGPPQRNIAFGAGPHFCPGAALTRAWLTIALAAFFGALAGARLAGGLDWQAGTLSMPREIRLARS